MVEAVGVADRVDGVADLEAVGVAELERRQVVAVDVEQREVARRVDADDLGRQLLPVGADLGRDLARALDDVRVGDDQAVGGDDEPGAGALPLADAAEMYATASLAPS